jgi:hypothetical protein
MKGYELSAFIRYWEMYEQLRELVASQGLVSLDFDS